MNIFDKAENQSVASDLKSVFKAVVGNIGNVSSSPPVPFTDDPFEFITSPDFMNIQLYDKQAYILEEFLSRDENGNRKYNTMILIAGMRSGKTSVAALYALFVLQWLLSLDNPQEYFGQLPGQRISIANIATSRSQAMDTIFARMTELMKQSDWWKRYINWLKAVELENQRPGSMLSWREGKEGRILFKHKNIEVVSLPSTSSAIVGRTAYLVMFDEISWLRRKNEGIAESRSAEMVWEALTSRVASLKGEIIAVSSPVHQDDFGMYLLKHAGTLITGEVGEKYIRPVWEKIPEKDKVSTWIAFHFSSFEFNPTLNENDSYFVSKKQADPIGYMRDYYAVPPASTHPFFPYAEVIDKCIDESLTPIVEVDVGEQISPSGMRMLYLKFGGLLRRPGDRVIIGVDAGNKEDAFAVGIAHAEPLPATYGLGRYLVVIDQVVGIEPNKAQRQVVYQDGMWEFVLDLVDALKPEAVVLDDWQSIMIQQQLELRGVSVVKVHSNFDTYSELRARVHGGLIKFPRGKHVEELKRLELRSGNKVDHPVGFSKDYADVIARIAYYIGTTEGLLSEEESSLSEETFELLGMARIGAPDPILQATVAKSKQKVKERYSRLNEKVNLPSYPGLDRLQQVMGDNLTYSFFTGIRDPFSSVFGSGMYVKKKNTVR